MRLSKRATIIVVAAILAAPPAAAQVPGLPVYNQGVPRGIGLYGDIGFPNDEAGGGTAYGVTGRAGFGFVGVTAMVSTYNPDGPVDSYTSFGATGNLRVFGGPLVPLSVTLQAGAGYSKIEDAKDYRFPVGLGFALTIPNPVLAIRPWLAPRLDIARIEIEGTGGAPDIYDTQTHFGLSGGIELNLLNGLGLHAAYDRVFDNSSSDPSVFGIGAHYSFRVPGL
jgi:hypothetical protein